MGDGLNLLNLILLIIAIVVFWKLRSVLGRRTGHERPRYDSYSGGENASGSANAGDGNDKVVQLPTARNAEAQQPGPAQMSGVEANSPLAQKLTEISLADRSFDPDGFLQGAKGAHEMIVTAFAAGDRQTLKPLLAKDVYESFEGAITDREHANRTTELHYVGLESADLVDAEMQGRNARVTVKFVSEQTTCTRNEDGVVVQGDPVTVRRVTDVWTFERDTRSRDPNWELVATDAG